MNRYFTIMVIPEREKGVKSFRVPRLIYRSVAFIVFIFSLLLGILGYDYFKILGQISENKHLTIENRQLKETIQNFQIRLETITGTIKEINTFEKKLRIITGSIDMSKQYGKQTTEQLDSPVKKKNLDLSFDNITQKMDYIHLKNEYDHRIASIFGLQSSYYYTKEWSRLTKQSFALSEVFAKFAYQAKVLEEFVKTLNIRIHRLDQYLLDKISFLKSTPTILPTKGWITSYYGPRKSPYSGRKKMHEGIDIGAKTLTPIIAPADGIVTFAGHKPGFGKLVQINHGYGIETIYGHAKTIRVKSGRKIARGEVIATVGSSGLSTGPHVHYEVRVNGVPVNPIYFILD